MNIVSALGINLFNPERTNSHEDYVRRLDGA